MRALRRVSFVAISLAMLWGCGGSNQQGSSNQPIIIGAAIALSGIIAPYDGPPLVGAQLEVDKINAAGGLLGRQLKIITADTHSDINLGSQAALSVISRGAQMVIVTCDFDYGGQAARTAGEHGLVAISTCAGSPKFGPSVLGPLAYTMGTAAQTFGATMAEYAYMKQNRRTAVVYTDTSIDYYKSLCTAVQTRFSELGGTLLRSDTFLQSDTTHSPEITRIQSLSSKPDVIFICSAAPGGTSALKEFRDAGITTPIFGGDAYDGYFWHSAVPNLSDFNYVSYVSIFGDDADSAVNQFGTEYKAKAGQPLANGSALTGYALIQSYQRAVQMSNSLKGADVAKQLDTFNNVPSILGNTTFSAQLHINVYRPVTVMRIDGGQSHFVSRWTPVKVPPLSA